MTMTNTAPVAVMIMTTSIIMNTIITMMRRAAAMTMSTIMSITTITKMRSAAAMAMSTITSITTIMKRASAAVATMRMNTIIMTMNAAVVTTITIIMPTRSSLPGVWRLPRSLTRQRWRKL